MSIFDRFVKKGVGANYEKRRAGLKADLTKRLLNNVNDDKERFPEHAENIDAFLPKMLQAIEKYVDDEQVSENSEGEIEKEIEDAATKFFLSEDRMLAYACILPPLGAGRDMTYESFLEDMHYEGISYGIMEGLARDMVAKGRYLHIFPVASGNMPMEGKDGEIIDLYERRGAVQLEVKEGISVDFGQKRFLQVIRKGEIICRINSPVKGKDGFDVTGQPLRCKDGVAAEIPEGENTKVSSDGQLLLASIDGVVVMENGKFRVERRNVVMGDVDASSPRIHCPGDLYIGGSVGGGVVVEAAGDVVIQGEVTNAHIISNNGSIRVQGGVRGENAATLKAAKQLQAPVIEAAKVVTGENIYAEVIISSNVTSDGAVYAMGGRGLILGGYVRARGCVSAKKIGNLSNQLNQITVGYCPGLSQKIEKVEADLEASKSTVEKLRRNITNMRAAGEALSRDKRALLEQIMEQRVLYEKREDDLNKELRGLKQELYAFNAGKVTCEELYPITKIQIAEKEIEINTAEKNCNIHVYAGRIVIR